MDGQPGTFHPRGRIKTQYVILTSRDECLINARRGTLQMKISRRLWSDISAAYSPDALVQRAELSHQLCGSFVLVAAQVVHSLYGLGRRLQLIFIDVDSLVLGFYGKESCTTLGRVEGSSCRGERQTVNMGIL